MNRVLFICPCATLENISKLKYQKKYYILPLGVLSIVSYCKKTVDSSICDFQILDFNTKQYAEISFAEMLSEIDQKIREFQPNIVGISTLFDSLLNTIEGISTHIKNINKNICVICGGTATSISYVDILSQNRNVDAVSFSEGEIPFSELSSSEDIFKELENNSAFITRNKLMIPEFQPQAKYLENLDEIPRLPYEMLNMDGYDNSYNEENDVRALVMHTARGCPFRCKFCTAPRLFGNKLRFMSAERVLEDLRYAVEKYGFQKVSIFDEQLLAKKDRAKQILTGIIDLGLQLEIDNGVNIALLDDEMIQLILKSNIKRFVLSIESGSQYVLNHLMHKPVKLDYVKQVLPKLAEGKFYITSNFVIGMPGETDEHRKETKEFILNSSLDWSVIFVAIPFKGTQLYDDCIKNNNITYDEQGVMRVATPEIDYKRLENQAYLMNLECNFVKNHAMRTGNYQKGKMLMARVKNKYAFHAFAHYYYAQCCFHLGEQEEYKKEMEIYFSIVHEDKQWKKYAELFELPLSHS